MVIAEGNNYLDLFNKLSEIPIKVRFFCPATDATFMQVFESHNLNSMENSMFRPIIFGFNPEPTDYAKYFSSFV